MLNYLEEKELFVKNVGNIAAVRESVSNEPSLSNNLSIHINFSILVSTNKDKLRILQREFFTLPAENFDLFTRRNVFPYEYIDCVEKLEDVFEETPRESF